MCGIGGAWAREGHCLDFADLKRMADRMIHRGPDGAGFLLDDLERQPLLLLGQPAGPVDPAAPAVGLVHRRLSIIDVAGGAQPIANEDGTCFVLCNGEIYNHVALRRELEAAGHRFRTHSDSEVVLHLYEEVGSAAFRRLDGIFAVALWDRARRRLLLARDRLGAKPLYVTRSGRRLAFASEVKALLALPWVRPEPDPLGVVEHFTYQNTLGSRSLFKGIEMLPAGSFLVVEPKREFLRQYWELEYEVDTSRDLASWAADLRDVFTDVVRAQLMSEVPVGTYLSGGMDTGAITAVAGRSVRPLHTFTCGFELPEQPDAHEAHFDEREAAVQLSSTLGTVHHEMLVRPGDLVDVMPSLVWHLDEPRVGISYQNYLVARLAASRVTVVLSGVGGDELFGGYPWRYRQVGEWRDDGVFRDGYYGLWQRLVPEERHRDFFSSRTLDGLGGASPRDGFDAVLGDRRFDDPVHRAMWFDAKTFLHGLLVVEDKLSMAHSLESRVPFCGNDLVDLVRRIPADLKFVGDETKVVLKHAFRGLLPDETLRRRKVGFTPPDATWYRGPMRPEVEGLLLSDRFLSRGWFRPEGLRRVVEEHMSGAQNHRFLLWSLMCFEWWQRLFFEGERPPPPTPSEASSSGGPVARVSEGHTCRTS